MVWSAEAIDVRVVGRPLRLGWRHGDNLQELIFLTLAETGNGCGYAEVRSRSAERVWGPCLDMLEADGRLLPSGMNMLLVRFLDRCT